MAITLPVDASVGAWVVGLVQAVNLPNPAATEIIRTEYAVEPWVRKWADTILSVVPDAY